MTAAGVTSPLSRLAALHERAVALLAACPWAVPALVMRTAAFVVFWRAGMVKLALADWPGILALFAEEYRVPGGALSADALVRRAVQR